jgi:competence CoiA-like predicted nuclease
MLLTAMLDGDRVDATTYTKEAWSELQNSEERKRMVMPVCGVRAVAKARGETTKFFAHLRKAGCKVDHGGETPQHLALKEALKDCIEQVPGWHAIVEHPHPSREWIIDVLAESDDLMRKVAFEVQLSSQTHDKYFARSQRYFDSNIFPVWLVPRQLEYHQTKVPMVVTGFGKSSTLLGDPVRTACPAGRPGLRPRPEQPRGLRGLPAPARPVLERRNPTGPGRCTEGRRRGSGGRGRSRAQEARSHRAGD